MSSYQLLIYPHSCFYFPIRFHQWFLFNFCLHNGNAIINFCAHCYLCGLFSSIMVYGGQLDLRMRSSTHFTRVCVAHDMICGIFPVRIRSPACYCDCRQRSVFPSSRARFQRFPDYPFLCKVSLSMHGVQN